MEDGLDRSVADLRARVRARLDELAPGDGAVVVAVSGGPDSVALLRLLHGGRRALVAAHLDHALRPESEADAVFVASLCDALGVPLVSDRVEVAGVAERRGWNVEDAGRRLRYAFLARTAREVDAGAVATAHTRDDQAETVLMQLLRGSAYPGGMRVRRGRVVRPLLAVGRAALLNALGELGQDYREDAGNRDISRLRAWVRHELLPRMAERSPDVARRLGHFAVVQADTASYLRAEAGRLWDEGALIADRLVRAPAALQREAVAELLRRGGVAPTWERIETARAAAASEHPVRRDLALDRVLRAAYGRLEIVGPPAPRRAAVAVREASQLPAGLPADLLERFPGLELRSRRPGDTIRLAAGTKKLSDLLIDRKIPREERDGLAVLATGETVLWVEGVGVAWGVAPGLEVAPVAGDDEAWMRRALVQARSAAEAGELPVGAVVVAGDRLLAEAHNLTERLSDPTAHAELLALRAAAAATDDWRLADATLYVTLEPCAMCLGATLQTHLARVVFGAYNRREGALGSVLDLRSGAPKRFPQVRSGVLAGPSSALLEAFFQTRRQASRKG